MQKIENLAKNTPFFYIFSIDKQKNTCYYLIIKGSTWMKASACLGFFGIALSLNDWVLFFCMMINVILTKTKYYHLYSSNTSNMMITISERINKSFLFIIPPPYGGKYSSFKCFVRYNNLYKNNLQLIKNNSNSLELFLLN